MYKILIVDDEKVERNGIKKLIQEYHFPLEVFEASNGKAALEYLNTSKVDILFTDIKMPFINGLELAKKAMEIVENLKVVIFSAYGEFEYAKEAVKLDVINYLLKPVVISEFQEVMTSVIYKCKMEEEKKKQEEVLLESYQRLRKYEQSKLLLDILNGEECEGAFEKILLPDNSMDFKHIFIAIIDFKVKFFDLNGKSFINELENLLNSKFIYLNINEFQSILIIEQLDDKPDKKDMTDFSKELMRLIPEKFGIQVSIVIGGPTEKVGDIKREYNQMERLLEYRFFFDESVALFTWEEETKLPHDEDYLDRIVANIGKYLDIKDYYSTGQGIELLFSSLKGKYNSIVFTKYLCIDILKKMFGKMDNDHADYFNQALDRVFKSDSLDSLQVFMTNVLDEIKSKEVKEDAKQKRNTVNEIIEFIKANYMKDISLESISKDVYLSPGYLSVFFKRETGQSLMKYITSYRLEKAKELLLDSNMKIADISNNVGFSDVSYFCMIFRNNYGLSPAKYKEKNN